MILSSVSETLASVSRHPALESAIAALRQGTARERLAGLTDTAKALLAAIVATELRRPMVVLVESGARAEVFAASMQFFYAALAGQFSEQQLLDLVFTVGQYHLVSMALNTMRVQRDDGVTDAPMPDR